MEILIEKKVVAELDRMYRSSRRAGSRLILTKALVDLGTGWHSIGEIRQKIRSYNPQLQIDPGKFIVYLCAGYPSLVDSNPNFTHLTTLKGAEFKIKDEVYPALSKNIEYYMNKLMEKNESE